MIGDAWGFLDPLYSSGVLLALRSGEMAADAIAEGLAKEDILPPSLENGARLSMRESIACAVSCANITTGSVSAGSSGTIRIFQGTVTDLLIGDLFTERVDKVWKPMESLYPEGKGPIPPWNQGAPVDVAPDKANDLKLPEGWKP